MQKKNLLQETAKIVSEIQTINLWIEDARTNRIAKIRYQKYKPRLTDVIWRHKKLTDQAMKEGLPCTSQRSQRKTSEDFI